MSPDSRAEQNHENHKDGVSDINRSQYTALNSASVWLRRSVGAFSCKVSDRRFLPTPPASCSLLLLTADGRSVGWGCITGGRRRPADSDPDPDPRGSRGSSSLVGQPLAAASAANTKHPDDRLPSASQLVTAVHLSLSLSLSLSPSLSPSPSRSRSRLAHALALALPLALALALALASLTLSLALASLSLTLTGAR